MDKTCNLFIKKIVDKLYDKLSAHYVDYELICDEPHRTFLYKHKNNCSSKEVKGYYLSLITLIEMWDADFTNLGQITWENSCYKARREENESLFISIDDIKKTVLATFNISKKQQKEISQKLKSEYRAAIGSSCDLNVINE